MIGERRNYLRALAGALGASLLSARGARARRHNHPHTVRHAHTHKPHIARHAHAHKPVHAHHPNPARPVIVIDPGHGGIDPGTVGYGGTLEKTATLQTALELARLLRAGGRYQVVLTRHDDRFVSLAERTACARVHDAALIISLHADASPDRNARGTSVYIRSNGTAASGFAGMAQALGDPPSARAGSAWLQYTMIDKLNDAIEMTAAPARSAHLWVLANHEIPGVLVEMGFLSNRQDEKLMRNGRHRLLIARLIRDAVDGYFASIGHHSEQRT